MADASPQHTAPCHSATGGTVLTLPLKRSLPDAVASKSGGRHLGGVGSFSTGAPREQPDIEEDDMLHSLPSNAVREGPASTSSALHSSHPRGRKSWADERALEVLAAVDAHYRSSIHASGAHAVLMSSRQSLDQPTQVAQGASSLSSRQSFDQPVQAVYDTVNSNGAAHGRVVPLAPTLPQLQQQQAAQPAMLQGDLQHLGRQHVQARFSAQNETRSAPDPHASSKHGARGPSSDSQLQILLRELAGAEVNRIVGRAPAGSKAQREQSAAPVEGASRASLEQPGPEGEWSLPMQPPPVAIGQAASLSGGQAPASSWSTIGRHDTSDERRLSACASNRSSGMSPYGHDGSTLADADALSYPWEGSSDNLSHDPRRSPASTANDSSTSTFFLPSSHGSSLMPSQHLPSVNMLMPPGRKPPIRRRPNRHASLPILQVRSSATSSTVHLLQRGPAASVNITTAGNSPLPLGVGSLESVEASFGFPKVQPGSPLSVSLGAQQQLRPGLWQGQLGSQSGLDGSFGRPTPFSAYSRYSSNNSTNRSSDIVEEGARSSTAVSGSILPARALASRPSGDLLATWGHSRASSGSLHMMERSASSRAQAAASASLAQLHRAVEKLMLTDAELYRQVHGAMAGISSLAKETKQLDFVRDATGATIINQYVVVKTLGRGSFGKVKLCLNTLDGQLYAIKMVDRANIVKQLQRPAKLLRRKGRLSSAAAESTVNSSSTGIPHQSAAPRGAAAHPNQRASMDEGATALAAVMREIAVMKKVRHPHVVKLHEVIDPPSANYIMLVQEYMECGPVQHTRGQAGYVRFTEERAREVFRQVLQGLDYLHYNNVVHGDLKPENLLQNVDGVVKIGDFGSSRVIGTSSLSSKVSNTPAFQAPEDLDGSVHSPFAADVWALGVCLYCFIYGSLPFRGTCAMDIYRSIRLHPVPYLEDVPVSDSLKTLVGRLLDKDPTTRITLQEALTDAWVMEGAVVPLLSLDQLTGDTTPTAIQVTRDEQDSAIQRNSVVPLIRARLKERQLAHGEFLFREGEEAHCIYLILSGLVELVNNTDSLFDQATPPISTSGHGTGPIGAPLDVSVQNSSGSHAFIATGGGHNDGASNNGCGTTHTIGGGCAGPAANNGVLLPLTGGGGSSDNAFGGSGPPTPFSQVQQYQHPPDGHLASNHTGFIEVLGGIYEEEEGQEEDEGLELEAEGSFDVDMADESLSLNTKEFGLPLVDGKLHVDRQQLHALRNRTRAAVLGESSEYVSAVKGPGQVVGEVSMDSIVGIHKCSARARGPCTVVTLTEENFIRALLTEYGSEFSGSLFSGANAHGAQSGMHRPGSASASDSYAFAGSSATFAHVLSSSHLDRDGVFHSLRGVQGVGHTPSLLSDSSLAFGRSGRGRSSAQTTATPAWGHHNSSSVVPGQGTGGVEGEVPIPSMVNGVPMASSRVRPREVVLDL